MLRKSYGDADSRRRILDFVSERHAGQHCRNGQAFTTHLHEVAYKVDDLLWQYLGNDLGLMLTPDQERQIWDSERAALLHDVIAMTHTTFDELIELANYNVAVMVATLTPDNRRQREARRIECAGMLGQAAITTQIVKLVELWHELTDAAGMFEAATTLELEVEARNYWVDRLIDYDTYHQALRRLRHEDAPGDLWREVQATIKQLVARCEVVRKQAALVERIAKRKRAEAEADT